ncbi:hypothetical protein Tco_0441987 [Tanacetum coccineum]
MSSATSAVAYLQFTPTRARQAFGEPMMLEGSEDPQTPPIPQDEDEHEFPAEEQPLPPVDLPTAESPGYVTESDPEEDLEDGADGKDDVDEEEEDET